MKKFKFTIVISAYNSEIGISKCITSITTQTLNFKDNTEIILINDGSRDNTDSICQVFAKKYPNNIKYFSIKHKGKGSSRNLGIKYAQGEYIYFIDGDDFLSKNALKNVLEFFNNNENVDIVTIPTKFLESEESYPVFDEKYKSTRVINLLEQPELIQVQSKSCFFKTSQMKQTKFSLS